MTIDIKQQLEARYAWEPIKDKLGSTSWKRSTINCEHLFEIFRDAIGDSVYIHNLIFIELDQPLTRKAFLVRLLNAWMNVRAERPIIAAKEKERLHEMEQAANNLVHRPAPRDPTLPAFTPATHAWEKFSREETKEITRYCKKYQMTATPFILSALLVRRIIDCVHQWPIPKEAIYTQIIPIDPRSILTEKRAVGMCSVYDFLIVPVGEIFNGRSKEEIERDIVEVIHQVSLQANETFAHDRLEQTRAEMLRYNEANLAPMLSAIATGDANPSTNIMNLYPDCVIGEPSLEKNITPTKEGVGSTVTDVYMHCKAELDTTFSRTWVFKGQTLISVNASYGFMKEEEAIRVVKDWKRDILNVCRESEWSEEAREEGLLGCNPSIVRI